MRMGLAIVLGLAVVAGSASVRAESEPKPVYDGLMVAGACSAEGNAAGTKICPIYLSGFITGYREAAAAAGQSVPFCLPRSEGSGLVDMDRVAVVLRPAAKASLGDFSKDIDFSPILLDVLTKNFPCSGASTP